MSQSSSNMSDASLAVSEIEIVSRQLPVTVRRDPDGTVVISQPTDDGDVVVVEIMGTNVRTFIAALERLAPPFASGSSAP